nr:hypothetical protein [Cupriavidus gilardii]
MQLFVEGHNHRRGYAVTPQYSPEEIRVMVAVSEPDSPVRFYPNLRHARRVVERFNRMAARRADLHR